MVLAPITEILVLVACGIAVGELFERIGIPAVAGQLVAGLALGPTLLNIIPNAAGLSLLSSVALFFVVFAIGFTLSTEDILKYIDGGLLLTLTSFFVPLAVIFVLSTYLLNFGPSADFVLAVAMAIPSISIISVLVSKSGLLQANMGRLILASVIISDIMAFLILPVGTGSFESTVLIVLYTAVLLVVFYYVDKTLHRESRRMRRIIEMIRKVSSNAHMAYAVIIILGLFIASIFESAGISYIVGAFFAGLILKEEAIGKATFWRVSLTLALMNETFFMPVFFVIAGASANFTPSAYPLLLPFIVIVAATLIASAVSTYYVSRKWIRMKYEINPGRTGMMLLGRGAIGIAIGVLALQNGTIGNTAYSMVVLATVVMGVCTAIGLRQYGTAQKRGVRMDS